MQPVKIVNRILTPIMFIVASIAHVGAHLWAVVLVCDWMRTQERTESLIVALLVSIWLNQWRRNLEDDLRREGTLSDAT